MKKSYSILVLFASIVISLNSLACTDFSGVYGDAGLFGCERWTQKVCESLTVETFDSNGNPYIGIDFITDGQYRKYIDSSYYSRAMLHRGDGTLIQSIIFDQSYSGQANVREKFYTYKLNNAGDIEAKYTIYYFNGNTPDEKLFKRRKFSNIQECLKIYN